MKTPAEILEALAAGDLDVPGALAALDHTRVEELTFATLDHDRTRRRGFPEVVYGEGKRPEEIADIVSRLADRSPNVLCTRASPEAARATVASVPAATWDETSRVLRVWRDLTVVGTAAVVSAGTSDRPVALEAVHCLEPLGIEADLIVDVGVAGLHRLLGKVERIRTADVVICVAGMEAALPSVVAGLVDRPVIAVPTSIGYGATFGGVAALLGCLSACAAGVVTVNIDNGFGAAYAAARIARQRVS